MAVRKGYEKKLRRACRNNNAGNDCAINTCILEGNFAVNLIKELKSKSVIETLYAHDVFDYRIVDRAALLKSLELFLSIYTHSD